MLKVPKKYFMIVAFILAIIIVRAFFYTTYTIKGESMYPTLNDGDRVIIEKKFNNLLPDDLIIFKKEGKEYIKRIKGIPRQKIVYNDSSQYFTINDEKIENCCKDYKYTISELYKDDNMVVPENHYFVMGDNQEVSIDSRNFGLIDQSQVIGKVTFRYWPLFTKSPPTE